MILGHHQFGNQLYNKQKIDYPKDSSTSVYWGNSIVMRRYFCNFPCSSSSIGGKTISRRND